MPIVRKIPGTEILLHTIKTNKFKSSRLTAYLTAPLTRENYLYDILLLRCIRRGTEKFPGLDAINRRLDELYSATLTADHFTFCESHVTELSAGMLDSDYLPEREDVSGGTIEILSEMLMHPLMTDAIITSEIKNLEDEIRSIKNDTELYSSVRCHSEMFGEYSIGINLLNCSDILKNATPEKVRSEYKRLICNSQVDFFYVGRTDADQIAIELANRFSGLGCSEKTEIGKKFIGNKDLRRIDERMNIKQSRLEIGFSDCPAYTDNDIIAVDAFEVMTEMINVRLFDTLREKLGLCYSVEAEYRPSIGVMFVSCAIDDEDRFVAEKGIFSVVKSISDGIFSDTELDSAIKKRINLYRAIPDGSEETDGFYRLSYVCKLGDTPESVCSRLAGIGRGDILAAARSVRADTVYFLSSGGEL